MKNEIMIYTSDELISQIEVRIEEETVWLSQQQMAMLFGKTKQNISLHINNCYREGELDKISTVKQYLRVQKEGKRTVERKIEYYNLDVIISVGYRVKSKQGTKFRIWANRVLKDYLLKGYSVNNRINRIEDSVYSLSYKVEQIEFEIKTQQLPNQGIFFDGQVFDAYELVSRIIRKANKSIVLIDNYIDETTLVHLSKKGKGVKVLLLTKNISKQLKLDVKKINEQYHGFTINKFTKSHDRFLIIDETEVYHMGASLKDLGKKWFAFSKMNTTSIQNILDAVKDEWRNR